MPRKQLKPRERRGIPDPDFKFGSTLASRFIGRINFEGKKITAEKIFYGALDQIQKKLNEDPMAVFTRAIENARPHLEVRPRRVGGATYQVPVEVRSSRRMALAMRWLIESARKRGENSMPRKLAGELLDASENRGGAIKKREETHRMAEANKAFAHYRW